jgi:hypothetical protein
MQTLRALLVPLGVIVATAAVAQTTAGTSTKIVVPVIAQTVSFGTEVTVYNPNAITIAVNPSFYDAQNTASPGAKACSSLSVGAGLSRTFSISTQCALPSGSNFGLLVLAEASGTKPFYGYARTQTPQGVGFSTEGFPIENFNDQTQHVTGLKRVAAAAGLPAFQTNCFATTLDDAIDYELRLFDGTTNVQLGNTLSGTLQPHQQFRFLDVFAAAGVSAGDRTNVRAQFTNLTGATKKLIGFCTVQENATFSADFRIAKSYGGTPANAFVQGGNAFGTTARLGTTDAQPLELAANGQRVMRYEPDATSPNLIGGFSGNAAGAFGGQTVAGGGQAGTCGAAGVPDRPCANNVNALFATVGGGFANSAEGPASTIAGGEINTTSGTDATVSGGGGNGALADSATIAGGQNNFAYGNTASIGGGLSNSATGGLSTISGGYTNTAFGAASTISGGTTNTASGDESTVAGGASNTASAHWSTAAGGNQNMASGTASLVAGGEGNTASGDHSAVLGGSTNAVSGSYGIAVGHDATVTNGKTFLWNGWSSGSAASFRDNGFQIHGQGGLDIEYGARRADGGGTAWVFIGNGFAGQAIATYTGAFLSTGGVWTNNSDRNRKTALEPVDTRAILDKVVALPISSWQYREEDARVRHIGPMAQDFHGAFGLGATDTAIGTVDADGVALAAIQGLHRLLEERDAQIVAQQRRLDALEAALNELKQALRASAR